MLAATIERESAPPTEKRRLFLIRSLPFSCGSCMDDDIIINDPAVKPSALLVPRENDHLLLQVNDQTTPFAKEAKVALGAFHVSLIAIRHPGDFLPLRFPALAHGSLKRALASLLAF